MTQESRQPVESLRGVRKGLPRNPARVSLSTPRWRERGDREGEIDSWLPSFAELVKTVKNKLNLTNYLASDINDAKKNH